MRKTVLLSVIFVAAVLAYLVISSFHRRPFRCQVCITFHGRRDCRVASAETRQTALQTATMNACGVLASGVIEANQCENTPPDSVEWLR